MALKVGDKILINNIELVVIKKIKGAKTNKVVYHSGILANGYMSKPSRYLLSDGQIITPGKITYKKLS